MEVLLNIFAILFIIGLIWLAFSWLFSGRQGESRNRFQAHRRSRLRELFPSGAASPADIVGTVMSNPEALTPEVHEFFWHLASETEVGAEEFVKAISSAHVPFNEYMEAYFEDALESIETGIPVKSELRKERERGFPVLEAERFAEDMGVSWSGLGEDAEALKAWLAGMDADMARIANRQPVSSTNWTHGAVILDAKTIRERLGLCQSTLIRLRQLFTKPSNFNPRSS